MIHLRNLKIDSLFLSTSKPFVELTIGDKCKKTKPQPGTTLPHFPETFTFIVRDLAQQVLQIKVKNKRTLGVDKILGSVDIPLSDVVLSGGALEQEYILNGSYAEFYVGFRLAVTSHSHTHVLISP